MDRPESVKERGSQRQTMKLQQSELSKHIEKKSYESKRLVSVCAAATLDKLSFFKSLTHEPTLRITIQTDVDENVWRVSRTFKNFEDLRVGLLHMHPESLIPPLPDIKINKELHEKRVTKIGEQCVKFLNHCYLSPTLRFSKYLHKFVSDELPVSEWIAHIREEPHPTNIG